MHVWRHLCVLAHGRPGDSLSSEHAAQTQTIRARARAREWLRLFLRSAPPSPRRWALETQPTRDRRARRGRRLLPRYGEGGSRYRDISTRRLGDAATQCRSIRGPRNTYGSLRFASVMCVNRSHRHQHNSARDTLGTCGRDASWY